MCLVVFLDAGDQLGTFEKKTVDARYRYYAKPASRTDDIIILDISEEAIKRLEPFYGRWPWPRSVHGEAAEYLEGDGASAIGFDIVFVEQSIRQEVDSETIDNLKALARNSDLPEIREELFYRLDALKPESSDMQFVKAVENAGNVFQASVFYVGESDFGEASNLKAGDAAAGKIKSALSNSAVPLNTKHRQNIYFNATVPFPALAKASRGTGHINIIPDSDGTYRRFTPFLWFMDAGLAYPSLSIAIAAHVIRNPSQFNKDGA